MSKLGVLPAAATIVNQVTRSEILEIVCIMNQSSNSNVGIDLQMTAKIFLFKMYSIAFTGKTDKQEPFISQVN